MLIDLDELPKLSSTLRWFSHNRFNIFALHDRDYGDGSAMPLRLQTEHHLTEAGLSCEGGAIHMLTMPRIFGYGFNPITIYFCYCRNGSLLALLYEVHNTFGQRHIYLIEAAASSGTVHQQCDKSFYVSPFMDMDMHYEFHVALPTSRIAVAIHTSTGGEPMLNAYLFGVRKALNNRALLRLCLAIPMVTLKVTTAIHWEALRLWLKGIRLRHRPAPPKQMVTIVPAHSHVSAHISANILD
jgi:DUF1365 family protein